MRAVRNSGPQGAHSAISEMQAYISCARDCCPAPLMAARAKGSGQSCGPFSHNSIKIT